MLKNKFTVVWVFRLFDGGIVKIFGGEFFLKKDNKLVTPLARNHEQVSRALPATAMLDQWRLKAVEHGSDKKKFIV